MVSDDQSLPLNLRHDQYLAISNHVTQVSFSAHPLNLYMSIRDKKGACHQLVNKGSLKWNK
ncbi:ABC-three component system protein [Limnobaculum eriocheiris]|uniref:ABC-three component system protein n=1 Tax=Limnobaculum eriocheiris TaxID=2897391 RepID=UPI003B849D34